MFQRCMFYWKGLRVLNVEQWKARLGAGTGVIKRLCWKDLSGYFHPQPYFSSICRHASHLGLQLMCWYNTQSLVVFVFPAILPTKTIFSHKCLHSTLKLFVADSGSAKKHLCRLIEAFSIKWHAMLKVIFIFNLKYITSDQKIFSRAI